jgi:hypothetical protein
MKFDWQNWNIGGRVIFVATCVATASIFMTWVDIGIASQSGISEGTFLFLVLWVYPVIMLFKNKNINWILGLACSGCSVVFTLIYISSKFLDFFGETENAAAYGAYLFLLASVVFIFGVVIYRPVSIDKKKAEQSNAPDEK